MMSAGKTGWLAGLLALVAIAASSCLPRSARTVELSVAGYTAQVEVSPGEQLSGQAAARIADELEDRAAMLDPNEGEVLGRLNWSELGEFIGAGPVADTLSDLLSYSQACFGAFDPTIQILWDVYDFELGGRPVSDRELADALEWVDYKELEMSGASILRRCEIVRTGLGPVMPGAVADWLRDAVIREGVESGKAQVGQCVTLWGEGLEDDVVYEFKYPLDALAEDVVQLTLGRIKLHSGDCLAALDDDEGFFFAGGDQYHMVLHPITGRPVRNMRAAVVVSEESCLQAAVFAYAIMVMGEDRGLEFLDETEGIEGLILTEEHEVRVSGGLGERFWR